MSYIYGIVFWNEETDREICAHFEAEDFWEADDIARPYQLPSFIKGTVHYLADSVEEIYSDYNTKLEDIKLT